MRDSIIDSLLDVPLEDSWTCPETAERRRGAGTATHFLTLGRSTAGVAANSTSSFSSVPPATLPQRNSVQDDRAVCVAFLSINHNSIVSVSVA